MKYIDQMGRSIEIKDRPNRIISLVPSITELLFDLGLGDYVVGVTKFCKYPEKVKRLPKIGGTKNFNMEVIDSLNPDLILGNKEENYKEGILELASKFPVWVSVVDNLETAFDMINKIGQVTGVTDKAIDLITQMRSRFSEINFSFNKTALYLIWRKPYMTVNNGTFISAMMDQCGLVNIVKGDLSYPQLDNVDLSDKPDLVLLSSEPYPFSEKHIPDIKELFPEATVLLVDGEMYSWFGSRILKAPEYFSKLYEKQRANIARKDY